MKHLVPIKHLLTVAIDAIASADTAVVIKEPVAVDGNISLLELVVLNRLVKRFNPRVVFEIGTFDGRTALNMAANSSLRTRVYTLDLPKKTSSTARVLPTNRRDASGWTDVKYLKFTATGQRFIHTSESRKIVRLLGDSATFDFRPYLGKVNLVFVDGSHSASYVRNDTEIAYKLVRKGGVILWHDYGVWFDVTTTLDAYQKSDKRFRSIKHIAETTFVIYTSV